MFSSLAANCTHLCSLELIRWNRLCAADLRPLSSLQHLTRLRISCPVLHAGDATVLPLPPRLRSLCFHCANDGAATLLAPAVARQTALTSLGFGVVNSDDAGPSAAVVDAAVRHLSQLRSVDIRFHRPSAEQLQGLATLRHLTSLVLCCSGRDEPPEAMVSQLAELAGGCAPRQAGPFGRLQALQLCAWIDAPPVQLRLLPLAGLEALDLSNVALQACRAACRMPAPHPCATSLPCLRLPCSLASRQQTDAASVQAAMPEELSRLSGLTSLALDVDEAYFDGVSAAQAPPLLPSAR